MSVPMYNVLKVIRPCDVRFSVSERKICGNHMVLLRPANQALQIAALGEG